MKPILIDVVQAMKTLGLNAEGLANAVRNHGLPAFRMAGEIKFKTTDIDLWVSEQSAANSIIDESDEELLRLIGVSVELSATRAADTPSVKKTEKLLAVHPILELDSPAPAPTSQTSRPRTVKPTSPAPAPIAASDDTLIPSSSRAPVAELDSSEEYFVLFDAFSIKFLIFDTLIRIEPSIKPESNTFEQLKETLRDLRVNIPDFDAVKKMLNQNPGRWALVEGAANPFSERANIVLSDDGTKAYATVCAVDEKAHIALADIEEALDSVGVSKGVDMNVARKIVEHKMFGHVAIIARGVDAIPGANARIEYLFDLEKTLSPQAMESGRVDYKSLEGITNVRAGDILAKIIPGSAGTPGMDVQGNDIPAPSGIIARLQPGDNVILSDDGLEMTAAIDGHVFKRDGMISVENVYHVPGDVDYSCGNIDFAGIVIIRGAVREGFSVSADSNIFVNDSVEGAALESRGGDISIRLGVQGQNKATLKAAGNISAKYINQATIEAGGDVSTQEAIMLSKVTAGGSVRALGPKGCVIGGNVHANNCIEAVSLGSDSHTKTFLTIESIDPESGAPVRTLINKRKNTVESEIRKLTSEIDRIKKRIDKKNPEKNLLQSAADHTRKVRSLEKERDIIVEEAVYFESRFGMSGTRFVRAVDTIHPQVFINIEGNKLRIEKAQKRATFCCDINEDRSIVCRETSV